MASHIAELTLKEDCKEPSLEEMRAEFAACKFDDTPLGAVIFTPSMLEKRWDRSGVYREIKRQAGVDMEKLVYELRRTRMVHDCLERGEEAKRAGRPTTRNDDEFIAACAKRMGYRAQVNVNDGRVYSGEFAFRVALHQVSARQRHPDFAGKSIAQQLEQQQAEVDKYEKSVVAYLDKVRTLPRVADEPTELHRQQVAARDAFLATQRALAANAQQ